MLITVQASVSSASVVRSVFRCFGQEYAAAVAWWTVVKVDPACARLEGHDVHVLEALSVDPRIRLYSVEELWLRVSRST